MWTKSTDKSLNCDLWINCELWKNIMAYFDTSAEFKGEFLFLRAYLDTVLENEYGAPAK